MIKLLESDLTNLSDELESLLSSAIILQSLSLSVPTVCEAVSGFIITQANPPSVPYARCLFYLLFYFSARELGLIILT